MYIYTVTQSVYIYSNSVYIYIYIQYIYTVYIYIYICGIYIYTVYIYTYRGRRLAGGGGLGYFYVNVTQGLEKTLTQLTWSKIPAENPEISKHFWMLFPNTEHVYLGIPMGKGKTYKDETPWSYVMYFNFYASKKRSISTKYQLIYAKKTLGQPTPPSAYIYIIIYLIMHI